jgi:hypothetical protein
MARTTARAPVASDPTIYPVETDMGEEILQTLILELLRPLLADFLASRGVRGLTGADQFIYWEPNNPTKALAPDIYFLPGVAPDTAVESWKTWERGVVPAFALEVVSRDPEKDYVTGPRAYAELGVKELVVFDPHAALERGRVTWQVFRRVGRRGLVRVLATDADRVESTVLGCWLRVVGQGHHGRVRVALGPHGDDLFPTPEERAIQADKERLAAEQERQAAEQERRAAELKLEETTRLLAEERQARLAAEARLAGASKPPAAGGGRVR